MRIDGLSDDGLKIEGLRTDGLRIDILIVIFMCVWFSPCGDLGWGAADPRASRRFQDPLTIELMFMFRVFCQFSKFWFE